MRLIDADALKEIIENSYEITWNHDYKGGFKDACVSILDEIDSAPTIEPDRKKGKWVRNFDGNEWYWFCSNCKEEWYEEDLWMGRNDFPNFCPNCGADMRGDQNED